MPGNKEIRRTTPVVGGLGEEDALGDLENKKVQGLLEFPTAGKWWCELLGV